MKVLELFAGSRSFSKVAEELEYETYTSDLKPFKNINQVCNIFNFNIEKMLSEFGKPDVIWASPPCTSFSVASVYRNWRLDKGVLQPISTKADYGLKVIAKTLQIIKTLQPKYFYIENPRGMLRKMPMMITTDFIRNTVWYCQYFDGVGINRAKPTDIWTNNYYWLPRQECSNGNRNCSHASAPRGSKTGTQALKNDYERSKVPRLLCKEILIASRI